MKGLINFTVHNRKVAVVLAVIIMISGVISYSSLPRQENPDVTSPSAMITTIYPGASAEEVESLITKKIENEISIIEGIENIESISSGNVSIVIVTINYSVDKDEQWSNLSKIIDSISDELPQGAYPPEIDTENLVETAGLIITLSGEEYSYDKLSYFAENIKNDLLRIEGIKKVNIDGNLEKQVYVEMNLDSLDKTNLSVEDIYNLLLIQNTNIPSGSLDTSSGKISVNIPGTFENIHDIENLVIHISNNFGITRLKDIAHIYMGYEENAKKFKTNNNPAVLITGYFKDDQNIVEIGEQVEYVLNKKLSELPATLEAEKLVYQPDEVKNSINKFIVNLLEGILFVIITVFIGMGYKNAAIVSTAIPFSIFLTFTAMRYLEIDLHQISIAALIIALGILVDNSIVVTDAIQVKLDEDVDPVRASIDGAIDTSGPVFSSTLTTVAAFAPLIALPGEAGEFAKSLPIVVIIALTASYISAMLLVPALTCIFKGKAKMILPKKNRTKKLFSTMLQFGLKHSVLTIVSIFSFFVVSIGIGLYFLPVEIFPYADKDYLYIDVSNEKKGDKDSTEKLIDDISRILDDEENIAGYTSSIGGYLPKFYLTVATGANSDHTGQLIVFLDDSKLIDKTSYADYLEKMLVDTLIGSRIEVKQPAISSPGADIEISMYDNDKKSLYSKAEDALREINSLESIKSTWSNIPKSVYQYNLEIDEDIASLMGLTKYDIQRQVNIALNGTDTSKLLTQNDEYDIYLESDIDSLGSLENLKIKSSFTGNKILLKQVSKVNLKSLIPIIHRYNRYPAVTINCDVKDYYNTQDAQVQIEELMNKTIDDTNILIDYGGEKETVTKYLGGIAEAALYALAAIYVILLIQFKSSRQSLIILLTVPLSVIGSLTGLYLFQQPFSFTAGLGLASLIGIVVNNAILLLEHINSEIKKGISIRNACESSLNRRFRPIMLSTITTVMGLLPLALSGSSFFTPMAVTLMSGLIVSTFFTLIVIPTMFNSIFNRTSK
ncbi:Multidrug efflux pump subunit AcrB [Dethiosulfatibacter aminovorans DSM 17477]|uniref:Multidrug efflux pump subunit AcrB n=1 Tax=Dethiosulfatibacter aminovorans DSM 17477 TaxID=1121476 RepID=A0A1M6FXA8_9FIRM|nr:efflux RND transporter permease subunit [Dethiosulfatibacter aminovorans]SHJ02239.1 Multidrug efflux pump subunit AcrB [Dethiosulfatibacter aminovorans DSM 17477]